LNSFQNLEKSNIFLNELHFPLTEIEAKPNIKQIKSIEAKPNIKQTISIEAKPNIKQTSRLNI